MATYLKAPEAAQELGISLNTLYAYVSRGLVRSEAGGGNSRERLYHSEDIHALKQRKEHRKQPAKAAEGALNWGTPVLESSITQILDGRLYYRGRDAVELAQESTAESVAHYMWTGNWPEIPIPTKSLPGLPNAPGTLTPVEKFQTLLPLMAAADPAAHDLNPAQSLRTGNKILHALASIAAGRHSAGNVTLALALQEAWIPKKPGAAKLIDATLILCADHELNTSSFTARCVASTGATLYGAVAAGLYALQGFRHGGSTGKVESFLHEVQIAGKAERVIGSYLKRGEAIPGFGHQLYPDGDPRAVCLLDLIRGRGADNAELAMSDSIQTAMDALLDARPNIDFALVTLSRCLRLPPGSPLCLFALGRTIGWIAHAMEQYASGSMIRPRARYVGPAAVNSVA